MTQKIWNMSILHQRALSSQIDLSSHKISEKVIKHILWNVYDFAFLGLIYPTLSKMLTFLKQSISLKKVNMLNLGQKMGIGILGIARIFFNKLEKK